MKNETQCIPVEIQEKLHNENIMKLYFSQESDTEQSPLPFHIQNGNNEE